MFKSEREGETADLFVGLVRALAILSFAPGGVPFLEEQPFDALKLLTGRYGAEEAKAFCHKALQPYFDTVVSDIAVTCWSEGIAFGPYNAIRWFEQASADDLLQLRVAGYQGSATWAADPLSLSGYAPHLLSHLFQQAQSRRSPGDQRFLAARDGSQTLAFQVEPQSAEAWLALYQHALLTGEHWLLPREPQRRKQKDKKKGKA